MKLSTVPHMIGLVGGAAAVFYVAVTGIDLWRRGCTPAEVTASVAIVLSLQVVVGGGFFGSLRVVDANGAPARTRPARLERGSFPWHKPRVAPTQGARLRVLIFDHVGRHSQMDCDSRSTSWSVVGAFGVRTRRPNTQNIQINT